MTTELRVEPFTNEFGQVINPDDDVIYAGTSWKSTNIRKGKFAGVRYGHDTYYDWSSRSHITKPDEPVMSVQVTVPGRRFKYVPGGDSHYEDVTRTATLPLKRVYKIDTQLVDLIGKGF